MVEKLYRLIDDEKIKWIEDDLTSMNLKGLCIDNIIVLDKYIDTEAEKHCVLAEEVGHYMTSKGNILNQKCLSSLKQEIKAREWAYENCISLDSLYGAFEKGAHNLFELASTLNVTEAFLHEAIMHFKSKYGMFFETDEYIVYFEPFGVMKKLMK